MVRNNYVFAGICITLVLFVHITFLGNIGFEFFYSHVRFLFRPPLYVTYSSPQVPDLPLHNNNSNNNNLVIAALIQAALIARALNLSFISFLSKQR